MSRNNCLRRKFLLLVLPLASAVRDEKKTAKAATASQQGFRDFLRPLGKTLCNSADCLLYMRGVKAQTTKEKQKEGDSPGLLDDPRLAWKSLNGNKAVSEDDYIIVKSSDNNFQFYGVFDGHGGAGASEFVQQALTKKLLTAIAKDKTAFLDLQEGARKEFFEKQFEEVQNDLLKKDVGLAGTTATVAIILEGRLFLAWVGDSVAALLRGNQTLHSTPEHTCEPGPDNPLSDEIELNEHITIEYYAMGSYCKDKASGAMVQMSRDFGEAYIHAIPEVAEWRQFQRHDMLLLGTDGFWDYPEIALRHGLAKDFVAYGKKEFFDVVRNETTNFKPEYWVYDKNHELKQIHLENNPEFAQLISMKQQELVNSQIAKVGNISFVEDLVQKAREAWKAENHIDDITLIAVEL